MKIEFVPIKYGIIFNFASLLHKKHIILCSTAFKMHKKTIFSVLSCLILI